jgi:hypothetical protein
MTIPPRTPTAGLSLRAAAGALLRFLGSLKLAVPLIVLLAVVLAGATLLDSWKGRDWALWYVYRHSWFVLLLAALAVNVLASVVIRFPWGWRRLGFLVTHVGLLVLMLGAILTFSWGIEGHLVFQEGGTANTISLADRCQFTATWQGRRGVHGELPIAFTLEPGPMDWPEGKTLQIGRLAEVGVKVLKFYRYARVQEDWVAQSDGPGSPAIRLGLAGPGGPMVRQDWLAADSPAAEFSIGPIRFEIQQATSPSIVEDFLKPPPADTDREGVLSVSYEGQVERIGVGTSVGKKLPVGKTKASVEIVRYLPDARPGSAGQFESQGTEPRNPMLELRVYLPGSDKPTRQIAFAKFPLLNLDRVHGRECPVKFYYHHPAVVPEPGIEFLQTPDGKLYCRVIREGKIEPRGAVGKGDQIEVSSQFTVSILEYLPKARRQVDFLPVELGPGESGGPEPAALVEITAGETTKQLWMRRNDPESGAQTIETSQGLLNVEFVQERLPLDFSLKLLRFIHGLNPGRMGDASFASLVRLTDKARGVDEELEISMNRPLQYGKFTFYQSSYQEAADGKYVSVLTAASDPGRPFKYAASLMISVGILLTICTSSLSPRLTRSVP